MRPAMKYYMLVAVPFMLLVCSCTGIGPAITHTLDALSIGWARHAIRLANQQTIDWHNTLVCATCLFAFTLGVHVFGRWFASHRQSKWPWKCTLILVGIMMLMFLAGIAAIGVAHEVAWMATTKESLIGSGLGATKKGR